MWVLKLCGARGGYVGGKHAELRDPQIPPKHLATAVSTEKRSRSAREATPATAQNAVAPHSHYARAPRAPTRQAWWSGPLAGGRGRWCPATSRGAAVSRPFFAKLDGRPNSTVFCQKPFLTAPRGEIGSQRRLRRGAPEALGAARCQVCPQPTPWRSVTP